MLTPDQRVGERVALTESYLAMSREFGEPSGVKPTHSRNN